MRRWSSILVATLLGAGAVAAESEIETDTEKPKTGWNAAFLPVFFATPETGSAGGIAILLTHRSAEADTDAPPQVLPFLAFLTVKKQAVVALAPELYARGGLWRFESEFSYQKFPTTFFGIGRDTPDDAEEEYAAEGGSIEIGLARKVSSAVRIGLSGNLRQLRIYDAEEGGLLETGRIAGHEGGRTAGIGPTIEYDTRDAIFYPSRGTWIKATGAFHSASLGSDFGYQNLAIDFRRYSSPRPGHIVALRVIGTERSGRVPFLDYASLGAVLRGIHGGRVMDRALVAAQLEYRFPIWWRFSGAAFVGTGDVAPGFDRLRGADMQAAGGAGIRFAIIPSEKANIRFDLAASRHGGQIYIDFREAF